jgi:hypothetical protein
MLVTMLKCRFKLPIMATKRQRCDAKSSECPGHCVGQSRLGYAVPRALTAMVMGFLDPVRDLPNCHAVSRDWNKAAGDAERNYVTSVTMTSLGPFVYADRPAAWRRWIQKGRLKRFTLRLRGPVTTHQVAYAVAEWVRDCGSLTHLAIDWHYPGFNHDYGRLKEWAVMPWPCQSLTYLDLRCANYSFPNDTWAVEWPSLTHLLLDERQLINGGQHVFDKTPNMQHFEFHGSTVSMVLANCIDDQHWLRHMALSWKQLRRLEIHCNKDDVSDGLWGVLSSFVAFKEMKVVQDLVQTRLHHLYWKWGEGNVLSWDKSTGGSTIQVWDEPNLALLLPLPTALGSCDLATMYKY